MKACVLTGMVLLSLSFAGLWWNHSFYPLFLFMSIGGIGIGIALPSLDALITEGIEKEERARYLRFTTVCGLSGLRSDRRFSPI